MTSAATTLTVTNVAPTIIQFAVPATGVEGTAISVSGSATDPAGALDPLTYTWTVAAGNGQPIAPGNGQNFSFTPTDDGTYDVTLTVSDGDGGTFAKTQSVTVANVAPSAPVLALTPVDRRKRRGHPGRDVHRFRSGAAPHRQHRLGRRLDSDRQPRGRGEERLGGHHTYLDDNPTGTASDVYRVGVTVTDDDSDTSPLATAFVTVTNVAPVFGAVTLTPGSIDENGGVTLAGTFADTSKSSAAPAPKRSSAR